MIDDRLVRKIREYRKEIEDRILRGKFDDWSHYQHTAGMLRGVNDVIELIKEIFKGDDNEST